MNSIDPTDICIKGNPYTNVECNGVATKRNFNIANFLCK
jgi:hypothetical protein